MGVNAFKLNIHTACLPEIDDRIFSEEVASTAVEYTQCILGILNPLLSVCSLENG